MIDVHAHVLWGMDDGAQDKETSLGMLAMAAAAGSTSVFATPHILDYKDRTPWSSICASVEELHKEAPDVKLYPGAEIMLSWEMLAAYDDDPGAYCLNGSRYALVELPMYQIPLCVDDFWYELRLMGKVPVLAHPERYPALWKQPERLLTWLKEGMLLQINGGSLLGSFGAMAQHNAKILLQNKLVSFVGSDAHGLGHRNTDLRALQEELVKLAGEETAHSICEAWPQYIIEDRLLELEIPAKLQSLPKPSLWQRLWGSKS